MDIFHEMNKYRRGKSEDGSDLFQVPLQTDEDGMIGRECPSGDCQPRYFKISINIPDDFSEISGDLSQAMLTCPYCGEVQNMQQFHTQQQIEWIESMITRDVFQSIDNMFKKSFGLTPSRSGSLFSIELSYKSGQLPSVRHFAENKLKRIVECDECAFRYAIYGISFHCPLCGKGNLMQHLLSSARTIEVLIEEEARIRRERGEMASQQMLGNALEDIVSLHEGFLKAIYVHAIRRKNSAEQANTLIGRIHTSFQRLSGAKELFQRDLNYDLFAHIDKSGMSFLQDSFLKRHALTHNLGLVDERYIGRARTYQRQGSELDIAPADVLRALSLVKGIISSVIAHFQNDPSST